MLIRLEDGAWHRVSSEQQGFSVLSRPLRPESAYFARLLDTGARVPWCREGEERPAITVSNGDTSLLHQYIPELFSSVLPKYRERFDALPADERSALTTAILALKDLILRELLVFFETERLRYPHLAEHSISYAELYGIFDTL